MRRALIFTFSALIVVGLCTSSSFAHRAKAGKSASLPISTSSPKARELYLKGMEDYENLYLERCNDDWRAAVIEDPNFAIAWAWIAFNSGNPQEVSEARNHAKELAPKATPGEQLMVAWIVKVQEGDTLGGIAAMNDMIAMYPKDRRVLYLAGNWLMGENGNDQAERMFVKALAIEPESADTLNNMAISAAMTGDDETAAKLFDRAAGLDPTNPVIRDNMHVARLTPAEPSNTS